jgi:hypothetical protein
MKQKFDVNPLVGPLPICFGMTEEQVLNLLGSPQMKDINRRKEPNWDYEEFSVRFGSHGEGVVEVGFLPEAEVSLSGIYLFGDPTAFIKVVSSRADVYEHYGFIVIPSLGMTFTGFHDGNEADKAITVFASGRWDDLKSEFVPFSPEQKGTRS